MTTTFILTGVDPRGNSIVVGLFTSEAAGHKEARKMRIESEITGLMLTPLTLEMEEIR